MSQALDYYKSAAASLRKAVQARQQEINDLRRSVTDKDSQIRGNIQDIQTRIREKEADMGRSQENQREPEKDRTIKLKEVLNLQNSLADNQHEISRYRDEVQKQIKVIEQEIQSVNRLIADIESQRLPLQSI